jgi:opacity protein-like surface antigen
MRIATGLVALFLIAAAVGAQTTAPSVHGGTSFTVGAEYSGFNPDYGCGSNLPFHCNNPRGGVLQGVGVFADYNLTPRWGGELEARWLPWNGVRSETEATYLAGIRYRIVNVGRFSGWGRFLLGDGHFDLPAIPGGLGLNEDTLVLAFGGTAEYRLMHRFSMRAGYEYQAWPSFEGVPTNVGGQLVSHSNGLTPNGVSIGLAYRFHF